MERVEVSIQGSSALLMNAYPMVEADGIDKRPPMDQAEHHLYRRPDNRAIHVPGVNLHRGIIAGAAYSKGKGRGSLQKIAAAAIFVNEPYLDLMPQDWALDSRPVVIPATRGRIVRHRARFDKWQLSATLEFDETLLNEKQLRRIVDDTGSRVGLLDFRPEKRGPFGRFVVIEWKKI